MIQENQKIWDRFDEDKKVVQKNIETIVKLHKDIKKNSNGLEHTDDKLHKLHK